MHPALGISDHVLSLRHVSIVDCTEFSFGVPVYTGLLHDTIQVVFSGKLSSIPQAPVIAKGLSISVAGSGQAAHNVVIKERE